MSHYVYEHHITGPPFLSIDVNGRSFPIQRLDSVKLYLIGYCLAEAEHLIRVFQKRPDPLAAEDVQGYFGALKGPLHWILVDEDGNPFPDEIKTFAKQVERGLQEVEEPQDGIVHKGSLAFLLERIQELRASLTNCLSLLPIYLTSKRGMFRAEALVECAEDHLTKTAKALMPEQCLMDVRAAGRCLAFDVETASAFYTVRAVESALKMYYRQLTGKTIEEVLEEKYRNWGSFHKELEKVGAPKSLLDELLIVKNAIRNRSSIPKLTWTPRKAYASFTVACR